MGDDGGVVGRKFHVQTLQIHAGFKISWRFERICLLKSIMNVFAQVFGLYLSNYIIVVISIDRCSAILDPISKNKAPKRTKSMLVVAYTSSLLLSVPQVSLKFMEFIQFYHFVQNLSLSFLFSSSKLHHYIQLY